MSTVRIALANLQYPATPDESIALAEQAIVRAGDGRADIICFPECFVPGYRPPGKAGAAAQRSVPRARLVGNRGCRSRVERRRRPWHRTRRAETRNRRAADFGARDSSRRHDRRLPGQSSTRSVGGGDVFCGLRPPSIHVRTVDVRHRHLPRRLALSGNGTLGSASGRARRLSSAFPRSRTWWIRPTQFADPANSFHEKAALCRAAENSCFFATVNYASVGSPTTSAVVRPDGTLVSYQPYGQPGLLIADIDTTDATGLLAARYKTP